MKAYIDAKVAIRQPIKQQMSVHRLFVQDHVYKNDHKVVFHILIRQLFAMLLQRKKKEVSQHGKKKWLRGRVASRKCLY